MRKLYLRMLREIKNNFGQFISIILIIAIGSFMFSGMLATIQSIHKGVDHYYIEQNMADAWVMFRGITEDQLGELEPGQDVVLEGRYTAGLDAVVKDHDVSLLLHSLTSLNAIYLSQGRMPEKDYECIIDSKFAKANEIAVGETVELNHTSFLIVGIGDSPENAYKVKDSATTHVSHKTFGIVYTTKASMVTILENSEEYVAQKATLMEQKNEQKRQASINELEKSLEAYQEVLVKTDQIDDTLRLLEQQESYQATIRQEEHASVIAVQGGIDTISTVSYLFPVIFFLVAAIILLITMTKMVEIQRTQIAILQAMGISKARIKSSYLFYAAIACLLGNILFAYLGTITIPKVLVRMFYNRFALGELTIYKSWQLIFAPFLLSLLCSLSAANMAVRGVLREVPAQAMRPKPPKKSKTILIEGITWLWRRLSYSTKLICRNIFLNKLRIFLSSIGVIGSVMLMITGLSLRDSANEVLEARQRGIAYDLSVVYQNPIEASEELFPGTDIRTIELTKTYHARIKENQYTSTTVQILAVGSELIKLYDKSGDLLTVGENSVIIPKSLAEEAGLEIGDTITLEDDSVTDTFTISDISVQYTSNVIYISEAEANEAKLPLDYNIAMVELIDKNELESLKEQLTQQEEVKAVNTRDDFSKVVEENLEMLNTIILIIIVAAGIMTITVIYNITSINIFERAREFATLMVLGYYDAEVSRLLFVENMLLTALGCIGGLPCGVLLFRIILDSFSNSGVILPTDIQAATILTAFGITLIITIITNLIMKKKLRNINMIEALKSIE